MKDARIVLVAEWSGWCGACSAERPLVLTRTGRRSLRAWLSATSPPDEVLTLTCRLCGVGAVVPSEDDDPEVPVEDAATPWGSELAGEAAGAARPPVAAVDVEAPSVPGPAALVPVDAEVTVAAELRTARQVVGAGLAALLDRRTASEATPAAVAAPVVPAPRAAPAPMTSLPVQRGSSESLGVDGIEALQLLAEGIDLLTPSRP